MGYVMLGLMKTMNTVNTMNKMNTINAINAMNVINNRPNYSEEKYRILQSHSRFFTHFSFDYNL